MADKPTQAEARGGNFEQFLRDAPSAKEVLGAGVVTLTGVVMRSDKAGMFVLAASDGQTHELPVEAVQRHEVIQDTPRQTLVRLELAAERLPAELARKPVAADAGISKVPWLDHTYKEVITDPLVDKRPWHDWHTHHWFDQIHKPPQLDPIATLVENIDAGTLAENIGQPGGEVTNPVNPAVGMAAGAAPFVMATPHHAPQAAVAMQSMAQLHTWPVIDRTFKEITKDPFFDGKLPWFDWPHTHPAIDNLQTLPRADDPFTLVEAIGGDPTNTLQEGVGVDLPGGGVVNPAVGMAASAQMAMRGGFGAGGFQGAIRTLPAIDMFHTAAFIDHHHTIKEVSKDPLIDIQTSPVYDGPITWVEGVGGDPTNTAQEGVGVGIPGGLVTNPAVWNLPGLMF